LHRLLGAFAILRKATISFVMSVRPSAQNSAATERMFVKFDSSIFLKSIEKIQVYSNRTRITDTLHVKYDHISLSFSSSEKCMRQKL